MMKVEALGVTVNISMADVVRLIVTDEARTVFNHLEAYLNSGLKLCAIDGLKEAIEWLRKYGTLDEFSGTAADLYGTMGAVLEKMDSEQRCSE